MASIGNPVRERDIPEPISVPDKVPAVMPDKVPSKTEPIKVPA
jgi:hypothetical protein